MAPPMTQEQSEQIEQCYLAYYRPLLSYARAALGREARARITTAATAREWADQLWASLNEDNKVSLFVEFIDLESKERETVIVNKHR